MTDLPPGWTEVSLGDVATSVKNGIFVSRPGTEPNGVPILRISAVRPGSLQLNDVRYTGKNVEELYRVGALLSPGDLLFTRYNGNVDYVGACALVPESVGPLSYPDKIIRVEVDRRVADPAFVRHVFGSPQVRARVRSLARTTAGQAGISGSNLRLVRFALPPLTEQYRIVSIVERFLSQVDAANQSLCNAQNKLPLLRNSSRQKAVLGGSLSGRNLPPGWRWGLLGDVVEKIETGRSFACEPRPARAGEWGVVKVSSMTWGRFIPGENKAIPSHVPIDPAHRIFRGDLLVSRANTEAYVGAPVLVREDPGRLLLSDKSLRLQVAVGVDKEWLIHALSSPLVRRQISAKATGVKDSMRNISQRALLDVEMPIPLLTSQSSSVSDLSDTLQAIDRLAGGVSTGRWRGVALRRAILRTAAEGSIVPQDPNDEPASELLARIRAERAVSIPKQRTGGRRTRKELPAPATRVTGDVFEQGELL